MGQRQRRRELCNGIVEDDGGINAASGLSDGCSIVPEEEEEEEAHRPLRMLTPEEAARWLSRAPSAEEYDYRHSTKEAYAATSAEEEAAAAEYVTSCSPFQRERAFLDLQYHGAYRVDRLRLQDALVQEAILDGSSSEAPWLIFTAGPMGAGKSHTVEWMSTRGYFPTPAMVKLDPDFFKTQLPEWKGYQEHNPSRAGSLTRRESGMILEIAQEAAMGRGKTVWVDGSFRDSEWYQQVFRQVRRPRALLYRSCQGCVMLIQCC